MKFRMTLLCGLLVGSNWALAQDQAQQNLRQQQQQEQKWHWHQMEQEAAQQQQISPPTPQPTGEWIKTWGAIADGTNGQGGVAVGQLSKASAENEAMNQCVRSGGLNCKSTFTYKNQCVVVTNSISGVSGVIQSAGSIETAKRMALQKCSSQNNGSDCEIAYSACSDPIFKRY